MTDPRLLLDLAQRIDRVRAGALQARLAHHRDHAARVLLATAYPALEAGLLSDPHPVPAPSARGRRELERGMAALVAETLDSGAFRDALRARARRERWRIALRELLPAALGGAELETTAREISDLADATIAVALAEAERAVLGRFGRPRSADDRLGRLVVLGMGKLGGRELNVGSDVDLICFYDSDDAVAQAPDGTRSEAHEVWTKVVQRLTANLEQLTDEGLVWRVDLRLRPEGARGPLVNSLAAAERYYESFGRLWERAALVRARPVAGDLDFGRQLLALLSPFVWHKRVEPEIAVGLYELVHRAQIAIAPGAALDLKLGPGGIREAELFVQILQLVWGGREPRLREPSTLGALSRLCAAGMVTEREAQDLGAAYVALRRAEHAVQLATGRQTHTLLEGEDLERLARALGFDLAASLITDLERHRRRVSELLSSLLPEGTPRPQRWTDAFHALDRSDFDAFARALEAQGMTAAAGDHDERLARELFDLGRAHPDGPLGARTRERRPAVGATLLDAVADAADPSQAARHLRAFAARRRHLEVDTELLAADPSAVRRLVTVLGGSAFVAEAVATRAELGDLVMFEGRVPTRDEAREEVATAMRTLADRDDAEATAGNLRRAQRRVTTLVALAELAGELDTRAATAVLSELADASLEAATRSALGRDEPVRGLALVAMGKLGGRAIGYGSDLDLIFVYDAARADPPPSDPLAFFSRAARRIIGLLTMPHGEGPGYELDTRLRPSGRHGLLVVSLEAFARYHGVGLDDAPPETPRADHAATWERLALLRARFAAGDAELGARVMEVAVAASYDRGGDLHELGQAIHVLRERMERELGRERPSQPALASSARYDLKFGRGGLVDVEFVVQVLQLVHGSHPSVRTSDTAAAIAALARIGALDEDQARALDEGLAFLRQLEQSLRIVHGDSSHLIEAEAAGLAPLARRMKMRDRPGRDAARALVDRYRMITQRVRRIYDAIVAHPADPTRRDEGAS
jgi:glutamate-ammonia-ligase adenylyltransferase